MPLEVSVAAELVLGCRARRPRPFGRQRRQRSGYLSVTPANRSGPNSLTGIARSLHAGTDRVRKPVLTCGDVGGRYRIRTCDAFATDLQSEHVADTRSPEICSWIGLNPGLSALLGTHHYLIAVLHGNVSAIGGRDG